VLAQRAELIANLTRVVRERYGAQFAVEPFGSTLYGVSSAASDLDLTIVCWLLLSEAE
jgi:predicted nucleotidyltransferase